MRRLFFFICAFFLALPVMAAPTLENPNPQYIPSIGGENITGGVGNIIAYFVGVSAALGIMAITWGGIQMIFAAGEEEKVKKARWIIIYALLGTLISASAYAIIRVVSNIDLSL